MEVSYQLHAPAASPQGKSPWYPLDRWLREISTHRGKLCEVFLTFVKQNCVGSFFWKLPPSNSEPKSSAWFFLWIQVSNKILFFFFFLIVRSVEASMRYEGVSKSFHTGRLERELQTVQLSATRCSCIAILWVSLVSFATITLCVASQLVFIIVVYFVIDSVRKLLDTPS
jgi:hypothetical protein